MGQKLQVMHTAALNTLGECVNIQTNGDFCTQWVLNQMASISSVRSRERIVKAAELSSREMGTQPARAKASTPRTHI